MKIALSAPSGMAPAAGARNLPDNFAQTAVNCHLASGEWRPWGSPGSSVATAGSSNGSTIYRFGQDETGDTQYWFTYAAVRDLCRVPVAGDGYETTIITGGSYPEIARNDISLTAAPYPSDTYKLAIGTPTTAIGTATVGGTATPNTSAEDRYYIYTFVTSWGEESAPSPAVGPASTKPGQYVDLATIPVAPSGGFVDRGNVTHKRIYRTNTGSTSTEYQYVDQIAIATTTYHDVIADGDLGEICATLDYDDPDANMHSVVGLTNGNVAGLVGNEVCFCEPYRPWAWPEKYRTAFDFKPIGQAAFGGYLVVCTNGDPYIGYATTPEAYTFERLRVAQGCVSKRSIVSTGDGVIYASPDGLVAVASGAAPVITEQFMDRAQWQLLNPSTIVGCFTEGRYHGWYSGASAPYSAWTGFILDLKAKTFTFTDIAASAVYVDPARDALYLQQGTAIKKWNAGSAATATWKSKKFETPKPLNFGAAQVIVTSGSVDLNVYAELGSNAEAIAVAATLPAMITVVGSTAVIKIAKTGITTAEPFRLPSDFMARTWEIELTGTGYASQIIVAQTMAELKDV